MPRRRQLQMCFRLWICKAWQRHGRWISLPRQSLPSFASCCRTNTAMSTSPVLLPCTSGSLPPPPFKHKYVLSVGHAMVRRVSILVHQTHRGLCWVEDDPILCFKCHVLDMQLLVSGMQAKYRHEGIFPGTNVQEWMWPTLVSLGQGTSILSLISDYCMEIYHLRSHATLSPKSTFNLQCMEELSKDVDAKADLDSQMRIGANVLMPGLDGSLFSDDSWWPKSEPGMVFSPVGPHSCNISANPNDFIPEEKLIRSS